MKRFFKIGLVTLFLLLLLVGGVTIHTILRSQANGRLINYVGIVRGATQRLVKLELAGRESNELIQYLDEILDNLNTGEGQYDLPIPDDTAYQEKLATLNQTWTRIKEQIAAYRDGTGDKSTLLVVSEEYFEQANDTVFAAEAYSVHETRVLFTVCMVMLGIMLLTWLVILLAFLNKMLRLEDRNKKLSDLALRDALTGVYLMEAFREKAQLLLDALPQERFALLYMDFTDFNYVNDLFGYQYGDTILARYGEILRAKLRENELAGRVSADNFVLLLRYRSREEVVERQRRADDEIAKFMQDAHEGRTIPTCCGICCVEDVVEEVKIDGLLDRANFARKIVKNDATRNYVFYDESIRRRLWEERNLENRMQEALQQREFAVYYQPKIVVESGKIGCAEALVRWIGPGGSIIPPDRFIPVFERKLMIDQLDQYVFEEVCGWLRGLLDAGVPALPVSVNVSRLQFYNQNFVRRYVEIRDQYAIPPELLEIEFTESIAIDNAGLMIRIVNELKREGFACSIDDFGKGYSSLSLLKNLPIDMLKIDGFFFADSSDRERDMAVVEGIIDLVKKFHIKTVAEGVEHPEQVEFLRRIGCDYVQGYVFYRPMPQAEYEKLLEKQSEKLPV